MNLPKVSIVILNFNGASYLKDVIPDILGLTYPSLEIIVVDNNSSDGSVEYLERYSHAIHTIKNSKNLGGNAGRNIGIRATSGEYILMLDGDIKLKQNDTIQKLVEIYQETPTAGFMQLPLIDVDKIKTTYYGIYFSIYDFHMNLRPRSLYEISERLPVLVPVGSPTGACVFFSRTFWKQFGEYDESQPYHMDEFDIGPRAYLMGFTNYLYTRCYALHLGIEHVKSLSVFKNRFKYIFSGHARGMLKNYNIANLALRFPIFFGYHFLKAIKYSILKRSVGVFGAYLKSLSLFLSVLSDTLRQRRLTQMNRVSPRDVFLSIEPPNF